MGGDSKLPRLTFLVGLGPMEKSRWGGRACVENTTARGKSIQCPPLAMAAAITGGVEARGLCFGRPVGCAATSAGVLRGLRRRGWRRTGGLALRGGRSRLCVRLRCRTRRWLRLRWHGIERLISSALCLFCARAAEQARKGIVQALTDRGWSKRARFRRCEGRPGAGERENVERRTRHKDQTM